MRDLIRAEWFKLKKSGTFKALIILNMTVFFCGLVYIFF